MIKAGIAEYAAILTGIGGISLSSFEPTLNAILIVGGIVVLFWLVLSQL